MQTPQLVLVYFSGCPNAQKARAALLEAGLSFQEVDQNELAEDHPLRSFSSPSILQDGALLFGAPSGSSGACSLEVPSAEELRKIKG